MKIKANVRYSERNNQYLYNNFEVVDFLPINAHEVRKVTIDGYNNFDCFNYDFYEVDIFHEEEFLFDETEDSEKDRYIETEYYAIKKEYEHDEESEEELENEK